MYGINYLLRGLLVFALFLSSSLVQSMSEISTTEDWEPEVQLVKGLLQAELIQLQGSENASFTSESIGGVRIYPAHLKAMYGVGQHILAEVEYNGKSYLYIRGQVWPIGDPGGASQLRLVAMTTRCVELAYKEQLLNACVVPQGGQP